MSKTIIKSDHPFSPLLFTQPAVIQYLQIIGIGLIAISIVYLLAANWWMLPKWVQLLIPQALVLTSALLSMRFSAREMVRQSLDGVVGLMLGLSLAVIGQIYQTGADSYQLFLLWALLLLPWLYRPNIGVFALFCVISQLALYLYFKQSFWMERAEPAYWLALNVLTGVSFFYALQFYSVLRYLLIVAVVIISIVSMFQFINSNSIWYLGSVLSLPLIFSAYFYSLRKQLETSLLVAGLALSMSVLILDLTKSYLQESAGGLLVLAVLIFAWFAGISGLLMKLLPKSRFSVIPLALGAWIAGIILAALLLTYWKSFSIFMGAVFIGAACWLIHTRNSVFLRQFAYCLWLCGQAAVLIHTEWLTDSLMLIWLIQLGITLLSMRSRMHWWVVLLQLLMAHILAIATFYSKIQHDQLLLIAMSINYLILIIILIRTSYWLESRYSKSIHLWMICILAATAILQTLFKQGGVHPADHHYLENLMVFYTLPAIWLLSFILLYKQQFNRHFLWLVPVLGIVLIWLGYFEILIILLLMAWAIVYRHVWIQALSILLLVFWLWMLYYNLGLSFLFKSLSIFASGLLVLLLAYVLNRPMLEDREGEPR
ncbi:DUF2157 domain-containing protein [Acinetobacter bohemicus]|uniref:DUF2157 domain-containing protein n=1 Tax=Acinetobacter sp. S4397-1 TaxID=2972915 RepID=UPI00209B0077|nr:DUF2157 domain-containing protein [Acinetobacter sp. S4397-1]MCO8044380.1 DUF2157 domain-containing protein [Acinetobacter sp. S4397-1]